MQTLAGEIKFFAFVQSEEYNSLFLEGQNPVFQKEVLPGLSKILLQSRKTFYPEAAM